MYRASIFILAIVLSTGAIVVSTGVLGLSLTEMSTAGSAEPARTALLPSFILHEQGGPVVAGMNKLYNGYLLLFLCGYYELSSRCS